MPVHHDTDSAFDRARRQTAHAMPADSHTKPAPHHRPWPPPLLELFAGAAAIIPIRPVRRNCAFIGAATTTTDAAGPARCTSSGTPSLHSPRKLRRNAAAQAVHASSNIFARHGSSRLKFAYKSGAIVLPDTNWIATGWSRAGGPDVTFDQCNGRLLEGIDPGIDASNAPAVGAPVLNIDLSSIAETSNETRALTQRFAGTASVAARRAKGKAFVLGVFEGR